MISLLQACVDKITAVKELYRVILCQPETAFLELRAGQIPDQDL